MGEEFVRLLLVFSFTREIEDGVRDETTVEAIGEGCRIEVEVSAFVTCELSWLRSLGTERSPADLCLL